MEKLMTRTTTIRTSIRLDDLVHIFTAEGRTLQVRADNASQDALQLAQQPGTALHMLIKETGMPSFYVQAPHKGMPLFLSGPEAPEKKYERALIYQQKRA